jgi:hypothetical protein
MKKVAVKIIESSNETVKIGDKFKAEISTKNGNGGGGGDTGGRDKTGGKRKPKQPSLRDIVVQFIVKQEAFNNEVVSFIKEQKEFNSKQEQFNNEQKEFNNRIETKVDNVIKLNNLKS